MRTAASKGRHSGLARFTRAPETVWLFDIQIKTLAREVAPSRICVTCGTVRLEPKGLLPCPRIQVGCFKLEEVMRVGALKMTLAQVAAGCLVVLMSFALASAHWMNRSMSPQAMSVGTWWETSVAALQEASQPMTRQAAAAAKTATPKRVCMTLDGKSFEWDFANVPFAVLSCSQ
jgi:hypothetical protein